MRLGATDHAVQRYQERVKPCLSLDAARRELEALLTVGVEAERPGWLDPRSAPEADRYLEISDGICAAVEGTAVVTVLTRGGMASAHRENLNKGKARKKKARQAARRANRRFAGTDPKVLWR